MNYDHHQKLENMASTALMLPKENGEEKVVIIAPSNGVGKILIREDTVLANLHGCTCGRAQFTCGGGQKQWSALCWGAQSDRKYYCLLTLLSATFVLSLIGTIFFCFTSTINDVILSNMVIRNNSLAYSIWRRPNVQPHMKVHIFNYTNWEAVRDGYEDKLKVEDVGPYVYSQQIERVNIKFDGDRLSFQERNNFTFLPEKSTGAYFDKVVVPNLPLLGVLSKAYDMNMNSFAQLGLDSALNTWANHPNAFLELPITRFLWGYEDSIISTAKPFLSIQGKLNFDNFGLLVTKNGTVSDRLTINTGENDKDKMNMIEKLNGEDSLKFWGSPECNRIEGSDGSIFPPTLLDRKIPLQVFMPNLCRRIPYLYEEDVEVADGITLLRYRMPKNAFDDPDHNPANQCYCEIDTGVCPPKGVINVTACAMGAPALVSFPHFNEGADILTEDIEGLHPNPNLYENFLDVHPTLGIALSGKSSLQLNIQVRRTEFFSSVKWMKNGLILPIAWIEMSVEELPESLRSLVYHGTYSTAAVQLGLIVISVLALIVSGLCLCVLLVRKRQKPCITIKKIPVDISELSPQ
ncbi:hypothetical protein O0L34_g12208 [Tuta absoluta]|nr:hypothetical protein O0L34_g12208 [Tuta absoluta]